MTASTAKTSSLPSLTTLYAGDDHITLHVKRENGPIICRCKVSKLIMCIASPVWRAMLGGRFMEGNVQNREIPLIDDDPEALLTVLRIAHHRTYEVPTGLTLLQLVNIATICDKYDTVAMCRPYIGIWVTPFIEIVEPSHQALYLSPGYESWLWCAWVFGYQETFSKLVNKLRVEISTDKEGCCYIPSDWEPNQLKLLKANMPSDLTGEILRLSLWQR
ncbi:hypothetical protein Vi05172_g11935 [Venturia inaequalis]|uniref:BTB domain-containing protein n=1 Tax=Venturia inaequalis TaxID=5025 RepID=A0A8H3ZGN6_VENIN|nr:hypothetical protein EG327_008268 [Venturia inaequalis]RDI78001.1 hypothetical protein Vi05172_g11935 [Venturia inaequalis]